jgi:hypothetical protein
MSGSDVAQAGGEEGGKLTTTLPTRVITYAWGEKYLDELLSLALPAVLAPGNLPYVATLASCEVVILTQEDFFAKVTNDPAVSRIQELCPVRLMGLDDLIIAPDKYGMALTYALHRGFADLGPAMIDSWLIFLNADFILADGSWRTLLTHLARGERIVASPSYCVKTSDVAPELRKRINFATSTLSIAPRDLAGLTLQNRHDTIKGKTVNQPFFSARYMDQFYWRVDESTLIGHQMPVAIVGMRPERHVREPNSFWDHGLMREFCPEAEICVIGNSDDFLMMELREKEVAADQIIHGWRTAKEIAEPMVLWVTPYQRELAKYPLTLHSGDLPPDLNEPRTQLRAFMDKVLSHAPTSLPSHIDHPQWEYHRLPFQEARHRYLSTRLGSITSTMPPPESMSELDRIWWQLDGLEKRHRKVFEINNLAAQKRALIQSAIDRLDEESESRCREIGSQILDELLKIEPQPNEVDPTANIFSNVLMNTRTKGGTASQSRHCIPESIVRFVEQEAVLRYEKKAMLHRMLEQVNREEQQYIIATKVEHESARRPLQLEYDRLLHRRIKSASIPRVTLHNGPITNIKTSSSAIAQLVRGGYSRIFGQFPRFTPLHPYWAATRHLVRLVDSAAQKGAKDVITIIGTSGMPDTVADHLRGLHARVSLVELLNGHLAKALDEPTKFDLCICNLGISEGNKFRDIIAMVEPCMRQGGKIIGFLPNFDLNPSLLASLDFVLDFQDSVTIFYAGSAESAELVRRLCRRTSAGQRRLISIIRLALQLLTMAPRTLMVNRKEAAATDEHLSRLPEICTSITIEWSLGDNWAPPRTYAHPMTA